MGQLRVTSSDVVDAAGRAVLVLGPVPPWQTWHVRSVALSATAGDPEARVYLGHEGPSNLLGGSWSGKLDTAEADQELQEGQFLTVVFGRGGPGTAVTATAVGERR